MNDHIIHVKKNDADIRNAFLKCVCDAAHTANQKLPRIEVFFQQ